MFINAKRFLYYLFPRGNNPVRRDDNTMVIDEIEQNNNKTIEAENMNNEKFQEEQKEKLEMATRQADRDQKTVQEYLTKDQYKNLTKPFVDSLTEYEQKNQPKYLSPYKVVSWTKQCKSFL